MFKKIIIILMVIVITGLGYWLYQSMSKSEESSAKERICIDAGGEISTSMCCKAIGDFPNTCLIGPCTCAPANSHQVKVCDCGPDKCFDGNKCLSLDETLTLLENLEQETEIDFPEIQPIEFKWAVKIDPNIQDVIVQGKGFEANRISDEKYKSIESFFENNGFEVDLYNVAAATISGTTGYKLALTGGGHLVCHFIGGASGYKEAEGHLILPESDIKDVEVRCGKIGKIDQMANWPVYQNEKYKYSFKYPIGCLFGPLPGYCKQKPPEERPRECRCYLNGEDTNSVFLGTYTGTKSDLTGASFVVFHSIYVDRYSPPAGTDLVDWVKENFPHYDDIPDEINMEIDGIPAVKIYTPFSGMAWSQEDIYFIKNDKLFQISLLDVDNEDNKTLYNQILSTFRFIEE